MVAYIISLKDGKVITGRPVVEPTVRCDHCGDLERAADAHGNLCHACWVGAMVETGHF